MVLHNPLHISMQVGSVTNPVQSDLRLTQTNREPERQKLKLKLFVVFWYQVNNYMHFLKNISF